MSNYTKSKAGSVLVTVGTSIMIIAIAVAALGAGGYGYMGVNPDAVSLVAGCALFSATLIATGILFMISGLTSRVNQVAEEVYELNARIGRLEREEEYMKDIESIVRSNDDNNRSRDLDTRFREIMQLMEERYRILDGRINETGREISTFQKVIEARPARRLDANA
jgi:outer membrane murein-binding lipoprotein Lpp